MRLAVATTLLLSAMACQQIRNPIPGDTPQPTIRPAGDVDVAWHGFGVHLEPTVILWAHDADVNIRDVIRRALRTSERRLHGRATNITIEAGGLTVIPDVGIGGGTDPITGEVRVAMDSRSHLGLHTMLTVWLPLAIAHELHHSKRVLDGPGLGTTLADALVAEGSAEAFVRAVYPNAPPIPWVRSLSREQAVEVWRRAQLERHELDDAAEHDAWFFGGKSLPRWAGYKIGYAMAEAYLHRNPEISAAELATLPTAEIFVGSNYDPTGS
jgi:hypothetical protein